MKKLLRTCASALALAAGIGMVATDALATEGYFQHAYGLRHKALAGAGVASIEDATGISLNPAGLVGIGDQFNMGISLFSPHRKAIVGAPAAGAPDIVPGTFKSSKKLFPVPTLAYVRQLDADSAFAISIFGNGGMNTTYKYNPGPFGVNGKTGVDLMQMFISAGYARRLSDSFSFGIAPLFALQRFKAYGLSNVCNLNVNPTPPPNVPLSSDPANCSDRGYSYSAGAGVRVGIMIKPSETVSFGASYQTRTWMSKFKKYRGLFAERGDFDIPANLQVGVAWQATPSLKLMLDYRHIFYSDIRSIANRQNEGGRGGEKNGPGFHWRDTNTIKVGLEYQATNDLILRAGYSYMWPQAMSKDAVMFNILAPGVIRHQITGGGTYRVDENNDIDFAFMFAPTGKQSGVVQTRAGSTQNVDLKMYQFEVSLGWTYNFGAGSSRAR